MSKYDISESEPESESISKLESTPESESEPEPEQEEKINYMGKTLKPFKINNVEFCFKKNIKIYSQDKNKSVWNTVEYKEELKYNEPITFIIFSSSFYNCVISHFIFDGFIYLQYFNELKKKLKDEYEITGIKVHLHKYPPRKFKNLFVKLFDISEEEILYSDITGSFWDSELNQFSDNYKFDELLPINNICIVPENIACHDGEKNIVESEKFKSIIFDYKLFINNKIEILDKKKKNLLIYYFL